MFFNKLTDITLPVIYWKSRVLQPTGATSKFYFLNIDMRNRMPST
jgi:hypothetical protein